MYFSAWQYNFFFINFLSDVTLKEYPVVEVYLRQLNHNAANRTMSAFTVHLNFASKV